MGTPTRRDDNRVHPGVDDLFFAERAGEGIVKEIEFDGAHGRNGNKKAFAYPSPATDTGHRRAKNVVVNCFPFPEEHPPHEVQHPMRCSTPLIER